MLGRGLWCRCGWMDRVISLEDSGLAFDGGFFDEGGGFGWGWNACGWVAG